MATKLGVINGALLDLGSRRVTDTGEDNEAVEDMVGVWDRVVDDCLSAGSWNFATETVKLEADTGVTPEFGFTEVFAKPSDWLRTAGVSLDEYFGRPLTQYYDDVGFLSADATPIYLRYVSNDTGMGLELARWTPAFTRYVELELAARVGGRVTQNGAIMVEVRKERDRARKAALTQDAMNEAQPKFLPPSSWTLARGGRSSRNDGGSRGSLIG